MFDAEQLPELKKLINEQAARDRALLDTLVADVRAAAGGVRVIKPRLATSVALMSADGGNNQVVFNPFYVQVIRVVDSHGKKLFLDVVSPTTDIAALSRKHLDATGPHTPLGRLMIDLGVGSLGELSHLMSPESRSWVQTYRDLCEWAALYDLICYKDFAQDTLIVHDGLLRCILFRGDLFIHMYGKMCAAIDRVAQRDRRRVWLVGLAKQNEVLDYYRLAISLSRIFDRGSPCYVPVPMAMQKRVYRWPEYIRRPDDDTPSDRTLRDRPTYNMGEMYFVRFGSRSGDPTWTVDLLQHQKTEARAVFGYLLADAVAGFPVPFYPNCLQQADNHSRVADLDLDIIENSLVDAIRDQVGPELAPIIDELRLATDVAARRYD